MKPTRIQLRRKKGWKMPDNTVKVDRSTPWGNPFITGKHGTQKRCVEKFLFLMSGYVAVSDDSFDDQQRLLDHAKAHLHELRGKNIACWCRKGTPCHGDVLLEIANAEGKPRINVDNWFDQYKK